MQPTWRTLRDPIHFLAFGGGAGLVPRAPGTAGSAVAIVAAWWLVTYPLVFQAALVAGIVAIGIYVCGASARKLGAHDHSGIVLDEIAGVLATTLAVPERSVFWLLLAFVLFRIFDIAKPWPIRDVDHRLGGGLGIMLDDLMAAGFAALSLAIIRTLLPTL